MLPGGRRALIDAPPPELAPVEDRHRHGFDRRDAQRWVPGDPQRQVRQARPFALRADDDAADRAEADVLIAVVDIDRPRCDPCELRIASPVAMGAPRGPISRRPTRMGVSAGNAETRASSSSSGRLRSSMRGVAGAAPTTCVLANSYKASLDVLRSAASTSAICRARGCSFSASAALSPNVAPDQMIETRSGHSCGWLVNTATAGTAGNSGSRASSRNANAGS
jgi:hypothetical protein